MRTRAAKVPGWTLVLVLFAVASLLLLRDYREFRRVSHESPIGKAALDAPVVGMNGSSLRLSTFRGRPLWLNYFATWCPPCKAEMPQIEQRYRHYRNAGLQVVGIDQEETPALIAPFTKALGVTFPVVIDNGAAAAVYKVFALPTSVFVDSRGVVQGFKIGQMTPAEMDANLARILDRG